jgi:peptidoglycan/xylan/chitin deacetylase (PgdA/CDA1 family)
LSRTATLARVLDRIRFLAPRGWNGLVAFNYHRIGEPGSSAFDRDLWSASAEDFASQVAFLRRELDIVHPRDVPDLQRVGRGRHALITFDDGYRDNYEVAFEVLRRHAVPGVFFVTTGFLDGRRVAWWDEISWMVRASGRPALAPAAWWGEGVELSGDRGRAIQRLLRAYKAIPGACGGEFLDALGEATGSGRCPREEAAATWMTWDMVREMRDAGMAIGGHTVSHPVLSRLTPEAQGEEIAGCARRLHEELGERMRWFAYPVGGRDAFDGDTRTHLAAAGVDLAFTYYGGHRRYDDWDPLDVRRIAVEMDVTAEVFRAMARWPALVGAPRGEPWSARVGETLRGWTGL